MTRYLGVVGHPIAHSLSPVFQQAALDYLGLDIRYEAWDRSPAELPRWVRGLRGEAYLGANVTVPHKEAMLHLVDEVDDTANDIGAVNTIVNRTGVLWGYNTDAAGFLRALSQRGGVSPDGLEVAILGAGGAARAVAYALAIQGASSIAVVNRTPERGQELVESLAATIRARGRGSTLRLSALPLGSQNAREAIACARLLVNCTTVGQRHGPAAGETLLLAADIPGDALVYELVTNPRRTPLLGEARKSGAATLDGVPMLVYQGAESFRLWTGREAPLEVMFAAVEAVLSAKES